MMDFSILSIDGNSHWTMFLRTGVAEIWAKYRKIAVKEFAFCKIGTFESVILLKQAPALVFF